MISPQTPASSRLPAGRKGLAILAAGAVLGLGAVGLWYVRTGAADPDALSPRADGAAGTQGSSVDQPGQTAAAELVAKIVNLSQRPPLGNSRKEVIANVQSTQREIIDTADKLLATPEAAGDEGDVLSAKALNAQLSALRFLMEFGDRKAFDEMKQRLDRHAGDTRQRMAAVVKQAGLVHRFTPRPGADAAALASLVADAKHYFSEVKPLTMTDVQVMKGLAGALEERKSDALAADLLVTCGERLSASEDQQLAGIGRMFIGQARRLGLPGQQMEVYGMRLDGQPIDWAAYRGKVVLIDFWATWCDACIREMPNILKNYALYHDRGFEVIGISSDEKREEVIALMASRKIPWAMAMASDFRGTGREMSLPDYYGITLYPTTILVDKEGKVVSLQARGPELGRQLEQLLGPPGEKEKKEVEKKEEGKQD